MNPTQLRTFLAVTAAGSFSSAARSVHVSQSTASLHVRELEDALGVQLLHRSPTGVLPTAAGELLVDYASRLLNLQREARAQVRAASQEPTASVVIAASPVAMGHALPALLARCRRAHPDVSLVVRSVERTQIDAALRSGGCDVALVDVAPVGMIARRVGVCEVVLVGAPGCEAPLRWVSEPPNTAVGAVGTQIAPSASPGIVMDCPHGVRSCVLAGAGVAFVDRLAVADDLATGRLRTLPWPGTPKEVDLWLVRFAESAPDAVEALFALA